MNQLSWNSLRNLLAEAADVLSMSDYNTRLVFSGLTVLGLVCGVTGTFLLLRKRSLTSDSLAHSTLPGLAIAFLFGVFTGGDGKTLATLLLGGALAAGAAAVVIVALPALSRIREDAALALSLTVFYGLGVVLLSVIQQLPRGRASGLEYFIYGQAASLSLSDMQLICIVVAACLLVCLLFFKEFSILCFDFAHAKTLGRRPMVMDFALMTLIVVVCIVGLQAVGLLLIMAMLITPAVAARFWARRLPVVTLVAGFIGGLSAFCGVLLSSLLPRFPTGAIIVLCASGLFLVSLIFGPCGGVLGNSLRNAKSRRAFQLRQFLRAVFDVMETPSPHHSFPVGSCAVCSLQGALPMEDLARQRAWSRRELRVLIRRAQREDLLQCQKDGQFFLTDAGRARARELAREHRLWELYLIRYAETAPSHVHQEVERIEEVAPPEIVQELSALFDAETKGICMPAEPHPAWLRKLPA